MHARLRGEAQRSEVEAALAAGESEGACEARQERGTGRHRAANADDIQGSEDLRV